MNHSNSSIQDRMRKDMQDRNLFQQAESYANTYLDQINDRNVFPTEEALIGLNQFDEPFAQESADPSEVLKQLQTFGAPATVTTMGGRYFGFVTGSIVPVGLAAKHLASYWDQVSAMHVISPIASKLESVVEGWLKEALGLPEQTVAGFVSGTSLANFCGLAAARYRVLKNADWDINEKGLFGAPKIRVVTGTHTHSTIKKAINLLGFGRESIEWVPVDNQGRMINRELPELDKQTILILQAGNVNSGSFDFFEEACLKAREAGAWVHIDGAFGLWAAAVDELKHLTKGIELANSWAVDGHKTLNTPYDSGIALCNDEEAFVSALHMAAGYIVLSKERDGMFYTPEMSRRARIIELWATMKYLGKSGINQMVYGMYERAKQFAEELKSIEGFNVLNDVVFNQVMVQCATDELTDLVIKRIQDLRECWVGGSTWNGRRIIRISVCSWVTTSKDVSRSVGSFKQALEEVQAQANI